MQHVVGHLAAVRGIFEAHAAMLAAAFTSAFVFLTFIGGAHLVQRRRAVRQRAIAFNPASAPQWAPADAPMASAFASHGNDVSELLFQIEKGLAGGGAGLSRARQELVRAGYFRKSAVLWFRVSRAALAVILGVGAVVVLQRVLPSASGLAVSVWAVLGAVIGLMVPVLLLHHHQRHLLQQCRDGFPNFLDLLVICSEAGLTPRAGIERISRELTRTHPFLGANLFLMCLQLRAGSSLSEAVESLGRRVQIQEVRSLGMLLQQTEELGTNLSGSLRVYSEEMRSRRLLQAEEKAQVLPVKLVLPLALFVFPVMLVVTLMPVFIRIHRALF